MKYLLNNNSQGYKKTTKLEYRHVAFVNSNKL